MKFHLVHHWLNLAVCHQIVKMMRLEIADTDGAYTFFFIQFLESTPCIFVFSFNWPMNEVQVDIFEAQLVQACLERLQRGIVTLVRIPDFRGDK
ncbi:hypothetical protein D1872_191830 [compost metagenome]